MARSRMPRRSCSCQVSWDIPCVARYRRPPRVKVPRRPEESAAQERVQERVAGLGERVGDRDAAPPARKKGREDSRSVPPLEFQKSDFRFQNLRLPLTFKFSVLSFHFSIVTVTGWR